MILELEETKEWLREDSDDPLVERTINRIMRAAEIYLYNATGKKHKKENELAKQYCLVLVSDWYENRELIGVKPSDKVRFTIQSMALQLKYCEESKEE